jgi:hypothetical protein
LIINGFPEQNNRLAQSFGELVILGCAHERSDSALSLRCDLMPMSFGKNEYSSQANDSFCWPILMETNIVVIAKDDSRQGAAEQIGRVWRVLDMGKKKGVLNGIEPTTLTRCANNWRKNSASRS